MMAADTSLPSRRSREARAKVGWETGSLCRSFQKPQQRRDAFAKVMRCHRFGAFGFLRRFRPFASVFGFCQGNDTRSVTRRNRFPSSSRRKPTSAVPFAALR
jgi:hypothetical protein